MREKSKWKPSPTQKEEEVQGRANLEGRATGSAGAHQVVEKQNRGQRFHTGAPFHGVRLCQTL